MLWSHGEFLNYHGCDILRTLPTRRSQSIHATGMICETTAISRQRSTEEHEEAEVYLHADGTRDAELSNVGARATAATNHGWRSAKVKQAILTGAVRASAFLVLACATTNLRGAAPPSEDLLPASSVGYLSIANPADLDKRFDRTQIGQFAQDPSLKPFIDQMRDSIQRRLGNIQERVGVSLEDLQDVAGGELAWAMIARESGRAASVLMVDTTGNAEKREELVAKIDRYLLARDAKKSTDEVAGISITNYEVPPQKEDDKAYTAAYFVVDTLFCVADHSTAVAELAQRVSGGPGDTIATLPEYQAVMAKCFDATHGMEPNVRWFIKPFPLVDAIRTIRPRTRAGEDRITQLREQGFDAVKAIGGLVTVSPTAEYDFVHRTAIYAPPVPGAPDGKRYRLGMNIFDTPNSEDLALHNWTPRMIARYTTVNIDLLNAFDNVGTLFDEMIAEYPGAFDTAMKRFKDDPFGPKIDFRNDIVANLGARVVAMTDYTLPIETDSERFLVAIDVKPGKMAALEEALGKYLEKDGYEKKELEGHEIWEFEPEPEEDFDIGLGDGGLFPEDAIAREEDDRLLTRSAVCVTQDLLFIASDVEFLSLVFQQATKNESLGESFDFLAVEGALAKLAPSQRCSWSFTRTDESIRPTYVLLRQNRLPESESFFARLLNELLTTPEQQKNQLLREQRLDGKNLPSYELARRYFGPTGRTVRADEDGWFVTGVVLNKAEN